MASFYEEIDVEERRLGSNQSVRKAALFKAVIVRGVADRRLLLLSLNTSENTQTLSDWERDDAAASGAAQRFVFGFAGSVG